MVGFFLIVVLLTVILPRKRVGQVWMETIITYFLPFVNREREIYARLCRDDIHRTMRGDDIQPMADEMQPAVDEIHAAHDEICGYAALYYQKNHP